MTKPKVARQLLHNCWVCGSKAEHPGKKIIDWKDSAWCSNTACENALWYKSPDGTAERWQRHAARHHQIYQRLAAADSLIAQVFAGTCHSCLIRDQKTNTCRMLETVDQCPVRTRRPDCPYIEIIDLVRKGPSQIL